LETIISLKNISFCYSEDDTSVVNNLSLTVHHGDFLSIVGDSSSGKSTLALILGKIIPEKYAGKFDGEISVDGTIGILFQQTDNQLFSLSVYDDIAFSLRCRNIEEEDVRRKVHNVAKLFGISMLLNRSSSTLSSGQKQKVALASIIISDPDILILDEPTSNIDPVSIEVIHRVLNQINKKGTTVIILENTNRQLTIGKRMLRLQNGQLSGNNIIDQSIDSYNDVKRPEIATVFKPSNQSRVINIENLSFHFPNGSEIFQNLNLELFAGNLYMIIGYNGSGKTTLAKLLIKSLKPQTGKINRHISQKNNLNIGYTFQNPNYQLFESTVYREIAFGLKGLKLDSKEIDDKVNYYLELFQIVHLKESDPHSLSIGQKRIVTITSILVMEPAVVILDEPTCGLDSYLSGTLLKGLLELKKTGKAIVILTHDIKYFADYSDTILAVKDKKLIPVQKGELFENSESIYSIPPDSNVNLESDKGKTQFRLPMLVKVLLLIALTCLVFIANDHVAIAAFLLCTLTLVVFFKSSIAKIKKISAFKRMMRFMLILPVFAFIFFWISEKDLALAGIMASGTISKIGILIYSVILFTTSTSEYEIIKTVKSIKLSPKYAFMFALSVRSLPLLFKDLNAILEIQKFRARKRNLNSLFALALPTFLTLIIRSIEISLSMYTKGFSNILNRGKK
jgi:energy-coupling factor transporter ATP-binding protein EcfA2/energy-coupling factor transporter transmembrane protein EcfT